MKSSNLSLGECNLFPRTLHRGCVPGWAENHGSLAQRFWPLHDSQVSVCTSHLIKKFKRIYERHITPTQGSSSGVPWKEKILESWQHDTLIFIQIN